MNGKNQIINYSAIEESIRNALSDPAAQQLNSREFEVKVNVKFESGLPPSERDRGLVNTFLNDVIRRTVLAVLKDFQPAWDVSISVESRPLFFDRPGELPGPAAISLPSEKPVSTEAITGGNHE